MARSKFAGQLSAREVGCEDPRARLQQARDPRRDGVDLHAGELSAVPDRLRHQRREQAGADARFEHTRAAPSEPQRTGPYRPDNRFRHEMGALRAARQRDIVRLRHGVLQFGAEVFPAVGERRLAGQAEDAVREVRLDEADEADQLALLIVGRRSLGSLYFRREPDRCDIAARLVS